MKGKLNKVAKVTLLVCVFLLLGLGIYYTYLSIRFRPYKVRVSNVTDSAFTVSWVTDEPMVGVVYYGDKDSFLPGPLSWLGKKRAFDDRDVSDAQTECVSKFNKKVSKNRDENFTVDASGFDCNDVKVIKKGQYYTHHVTVPNLDADKEYYFRVGNGYISFKEGKIKGVEYIEREMPAVGEFKQKTRETIKDISSPKPAYGTSYNVFYSSDGQVGTKKSFDSVIFLKTFKNGEEYPLMSAVTNSNGGWSIDLSNVRDKDNNILAMEDTYLEFIPQVDNARPGASGTTKFEKLSFPLDLMGNNIDDLNKEVKREESELGVLLKGLVAGVGAYGYDDEDRIECWRIGDCQYKVFNTGACPSGYTPVKDKCQTTTPPPKVDNPLCCSATCNCKTDWVTCPGGYTKYESKAACLKAKETETKVSCCVQSGPSDCQCITNRDEGSCRGDYPNQYNTNNKADAIAQCKANLPPPPKDNCYTYNSTDNSCTGPKPCTSGTITWKECQDKRKSVGTKSCCKVVSKSSSGVSCTCEDKSSCAPGEIEGSKARCEGCFKVVKGECKNGCQGYSVVNSCLGSGGGVGGPVNMWTRLFSPFEDLLVNKSYAQDIPTIDDNYTVCPVGQESCESDGGAKDKCLYQGQEVAPGVCAGSDLICYQYSLVSDGTQNGYPSCDSPGKLAENRLMCVTSKNGKSCANSFTKAYTFSEIKDCWRKDTSGQDCTAYNTTADTCEEGYEDMNECRKAEFPLCEDAHSPVVTACVCPPESIFSDFIQLGGNNCGGLDYRLQTCYYPDEKMESCSLYKSSNGETSISYGECVNKGGSELQIDCLSSLRGNGGELFCWEKSANGECNPSNIERKSNPNCLGGLYTSRYECLGPNASCYIASVSDARCDKVTNTFECFDVMGGPFVRTARSAFPTLERCNDYLKTQLQGNTIRGGERCSASMPCYCSSSGEYVTPGNCCGSTRYGFNRVSAGYPGSKCEVSGNGAYCNMEECSLAREAVTLVNIETIREGDGRDFSSSYDSRTQQVCAQPVGGQCSKYELLDAFYKDLSPCDKSKCGIVGFEPGPIALVHRAYAQDGSDGQWEDNVVFYSPEDGVYEVTSSDGVSRTILGGQATVFYQERNGVEGFQPPEDPQNPKDDEDRIVSGSSLSVSKVADLKKVSLKEGINIISFNLLPSLGTLEEKLTFGDFLRIANRDGKNVSRIATFHAGSWDGGAHYDFTTKEIKGGVDKVLTVGIGYLVLAEKDTTISVPGYAIESPVPIAFSSGWNLIGVHGHDTQYTAKSLINSVNSIEGLKANNVTYWPTSKGMYQGFQLSEGQEYGQDFPISPDLGYFVRINEIREGCRSIWWNPGGEGNGNCSSQ